VVGVVGQSRKPVVILLDTMVVAGMFAVTKQGGGVEWIEGRKKNWRTAVDNLTAKVGEGVILKVPTPVCYELMCWNEGWYKQVTSGRNPVFAYAKNNIHSKFLLMAARYSVECRVEYFDSTKYKVKTMDPLVAAYSMVFGYYLLTENQKDFPESHFSVVEIEPLVLKEKKGQVRKVLYLLQPKKVG